MRRCPECGKQLGLTVQKGFCSYVCRVVHHARHRHRRRERWQRWFAWRFSLNKPVIR